MGMGSNLAWNILEVIFGDSDTEGGSDGDDDSDGNNNDDLKGMSFPLCIFFSNFFTSLSLLALFPIA